jgi:hypothetical protein
MDEVFRFENEGAGWWNTLKDYKNSMDTPPTLRNEVVALMDSLYGPRIPEEGIIIPERQLLGESTMQALAESKRADSSISGHST